MIDTTVPVRVNDFVLEQLDGHTLLYHPGLTKTVWLNPTAFMVWSLCDGQRSVRDISQLIADAFAESGGVADDVAQILGRLLEEGAIR